MFDVVDDPLDPSRRYGLGRGTSGDGFVHFVVSTNAGASWSRVPADGLPPGGQQLADPDAPSVIHFGETAPLRLIVYRIALDPGDASTLYATAYEGHGILNAYRVFRSTDSGRTWERITAEDDTEWRLQIAVDAVGDLYAADRQTMWRFAKATQTWERWTVPGLPGPSILLANPQRPECCMPRTGAGRAVGPIPQRRRRRHLDGVALAG